jgi:hypothetical protein
VSSGNKLIFHLLFNLELLLAHANYGRLDKEKMIFLSLIHEKAAKCLPINLPIKIVFRVRQRLIFTPISL